MAIPVFNARPWRHASDPKKILVMRFQALGDMVITLPYLQDLKDRLPDTIIHFLTREEIGELPRQLDMFQRVIIIKGGRNPRLQLFSCMMWLPWLWWQRYDVVLDLQNHRLSRIIRKLLFCKSWSEFDRASQVSAGERTRAAINNARIATVGIVPGIRMKAHLPVANKMIAKGWKEGAPFILLNPAGAFPSRSWPLVYYLDFARRWLARNPSMQFMVVGLGSLSSKIAPLKTELGTQLIDLTGDTTAPEAFEIVARATLVLSEDSGLMHMAWTQGIPTIAVFGSTPAVWSTPLGDRTFCFNSSDLSCGNCFLEICKYGDTHCLKRVTGEMVFSKSVELLS